MNTFSPETKERICVAQNGYCAGCTNPIHSIHHMLNNNKDNRKSFPIFINSPMNGKGLCLQCHTDNSHKYKITEKEAEVYEKWLEWMFNENCKLLTEKKI